jgi:hypothetical protein
MASYKLNVARIKGCPAPARLAEALAEYGLPADDEFGVLNHSATSENVFGTIVRRTQQSVQQLDAEAKEVTSAPVERVQLYAFGIRPASETLELYSGSAAAFEQMGFFLGSCLALPVVVEAIEVDVAAALEKLAKTVEKFQIKSVRVGDFSHNSFMTGPYAPKFLDSEHGKDFLEEYAESVTAASVRFACPMGRVNARITPNACFGFSCHEEDRPVVMSYLRKLL